MRTTMVVPAALLCVAGCATAPADIEATYVSPLPYQNLTCAQLDGEWARVSQAEDLAAANQERKAQRDAANMGIGMVLFWPSLLFIKGDDETASSLAQLRGEQDALQQAAARGNCGTLGVAPLPATPTVITAPQ